MKVLALLLAALMAPAGGATTTDPAPAIAAPSADAELLEALNRDWLNAYKNRDGAALERILADDFEAVYPGNRVLKKADLIAGAIGTSRIIETISWDNLRILVFGDVAVVTARSTLSGTTGGKAFSTTNDYADFYAKRDGQWRAISAHVVRFVPASAI